MLIMDGRPCIDEMKVRLKVIEGILKKKPY
jgi:hypothetical protein